MGTGSPGVLQGEGCEGAGACNPMTGNRKLKIIYPTREAVQWKRPAPKVKRMDRDNNQHEGYSRKGGFKSAFVNMRNTVIGNYHVEDYLFAEDHPGLDEQDGYSNHYWSVTCAACGTDAILERRLIRGKTQRQCPVCKERNKLEARLTRKQKRSLGSIREKIASDTQKACKLFDKGTPVPLIADILDRSVMSVRAFLRKTGRNPRARYFSQLKANAKPPEKLWKADPENQRRQSQAYHHKKREEIAAMDPTREIRDGRLRFTKEALEQRAMDSRAKYDAKRKAASQAARRIKLGVPDGVEWPFTTLPFNVALTARDRSRRGETWEILGERLGYSVKTLKRGAEIVRGMSVGK